MQDRYAGDVGDYVKLGLLRALAPGRKLGIAWYLYPDEAHNADGRHIAYLGDPDFWRAFDPELFDALRAIVGGRRSVEALEARAIAGAAFHRTLIVQSPGTGVSHHIHRAQWFEAASDALRGCDLVFADPDNGLVADDHRASGLRAHGKRITLSEALTLAAGRTAIIYHHNSRFKGGHDREVAYWLDRLGPRALAVRANAYSCRTFFIVNADPAIERRAADFCTRWSAAKVRLHPSAG